MDNANFIKIKQNIVMWVFATSDSYKQAEGTQEHVGPLPVEEQDICQYSYTSLRTL